MLKRVFIIIIALISTLGVTAHASSWDVARGAQMPEHIGHDMGAVGHDMSSVGHDAVLGTWKGSISAQGQRLEMYFTIQEVDGILTAYMSVPSQGVKGMLLEKASFDGFNLILEHSPIQMKYSGKLIMGTFTGTFSQYGMEFPMALTKGEIPIAKRPQEPQRPYPYIEREVVFSNDKAGIRLAGTLTLPFGNGPFPGVVLVSGSGYQNRDEELMEHKPFLVIADALTKRGIAVLRYDDRGVGESEGITQGNTTEDLSWDAQAALHYLKSCPEISSAGIAGHSEGGAIAFIVAARDHECDFVISLAGPGMRGDKVLLTQQKAIYTASGIPTQQVEQIVTGNKILFDMVLASESNDEALRAKISSVLPGQQEAWEQILNPWMYYFIKYDPTADIRGVKVPMLALNGTRDMQVICDLNLNAIAEKNPQAKIVKFEGLNHLFQHCSTGLPTEYSQIEETIAPEVLEEIIGFITTFAAP